MSANAYNMEKSTYCLCDKVLGTVAQSVGTVTDYSKVVDSTTQDGIFVPTESHV